MKSSLKKSLYVGLAAVSVLAASSLAATTASAKTYAYVTKPAYFTSAPESRNVVPTGQNALYSKPGTVKGARVIASKTTMGNLANSKKSSDFFRAYSIVSTNRGSVYYKVVSFDGNYRGWVYGGKSTKAFAGGITPATTTKSATMPGTTTGYTIVNAAKNTIWTAPKNTQYKAAKISGFDSSDTFTVTGAATKAREGSLYYQVKDDQKPSVTGWIYYTGVQAPQGNSVKVSYVDKDSNNQVGTGSVPFDKSATTVNVTDTANLNSVVNGVPSGYVPYDNDNGGAASIADRSAAATAKNGDTVVYYVKAADTANLTTSINVQPEKSDGSSIELKSQDQAALDASAKKTKFQVKPGDTITANNVANIINDANLRTIVANDGTTYVFDHAADTPSAAGNATPSVRAYYRATF
ncbi:S-layer protein [Secundilactobacillus hailunensis]|uniref:S-layer protein n=1 Tax=Secundilactobacillus hailunensis TaxID=2559923 RepID=A0ABW1TB87_9LACO|nr:S-layer protein [Secundilactobacillus hailunensis]